MPKKSTHPQIEFQRPLNHSHFGGRQLPDRSNHHLTTWRTQATVRADLLDRRLVRPYQVLQECREYAYARRYLPHWRYVPDAALPALLARPEGSAA